MLKEPPVYLQHWDYVLKEMNWMSVDFEEERKLKISCLYRLAHEAKDFVQRTQIQKVKEEIQQKKVSLQLAYMVNHFYR